MQQTDDIVSGWLGGSDSIDGHDNPAGPLYIEGLAATEAGLTSAGPQVSMGTLCASLHGGTTCSFGGGCACC